MTAARRSLEVSQVLAPPQGPFPLIQLEMRLLFPEEITNRCAGFAEEVG